MPITWQWVMVAPDGTETLLNEAMAHPLVGVTWVPLPELMLPHPVWKRDKDDPNEAVQVM